MLKKYYSAEEFIKEYSVIEKNLRVLNAGSSSVRFGENCINIDIQDKPNVDVVCDVHQLPQNLGAFDIIVCNAVLQYCHDPKQVAEQFYNSLLPGGLLFVDAPWVQPYCEDTADKFRFSEEGLQSVFSQFEIIKSGPSINSGAAFSDLGVKIASDISTNRYLRYGLRHIVMACLYPFRFIKTKKEKNTAGAFYLIGRKPLSD